MDTHSGYNRHASRDGAPLLGTLDPDLEESDLLHLPHPEDLSTGAAIASNRASFRNDEEQDMASVDIVMMDDEDQEENIIDSLAIRPKPTRLRFDGAFSGAGFRVF